MSDTPPDPTLPVDDPDATPEWFDPDIPEFARDYEADDQALAKLLRPADQAPAVDPDEPLPDESQAIDDETPDETPPTPTPAPVADASGGTGADATPTPPPATTSTPEPQYFEIGGRRYPMDQAAQVLQLIDLGIAKIQETPLIPIAPQPEAPAGPDVPVFDPDSYVDPELARATQAQLEAIRQSQQPLADKLERVEQILSRQEQAAEQARQAQMNADEKVVVDEIKAKFALNDDEMADLYSITEKSGVVNGIVAADPTSINDYSNVARTALERMYWATEKFRERDIQSRVAAQVADSVQSQQVAGKKKKAGALAGGGGAVTRTPAPTKNPMGGPRDPMAEALAAVSEEVV